MERSKIGLIARLWAHLGRRRKNQCVLLLILMAVSALAEVASLGAVVPFLAFLVSPERMGDWPLVSGILLRFGVAGSDDALVFLTAVFCTTALLAGCVRLAVLWVTARWSAAVTSELGDRMYRRTLYQPYDVHVSRNSAQLISGIQTKVGNASTVLNQTLVLISSLVISLTIFLALIAINRAVAIATMVTFAFCYLGIFWLFRVRILHNSAIIAENAPNVIRAIQEGLGGIRDVILDGSQEVYRAVYRRANDKLLLAQSHNSFMSVCPRYIIEAVGMVTIALFAYFLSQKADPGFGAIPVLGSLALGAQRMLPALQAGYGAWANILGSSASAWDALAILDQPMPGSELLRERAPLAFREEICFESVSFAYDRAPCDALKNLNFCIKRGSSTGIIGTTGSGKSTAMDLLMGLLVPSSGDIKVDGQSLRSPEARRAWQANIAHVPQAVFLADASLLENIAIGTPIDAIDIGRARSAADQARLGDFIDGQPQGLLTRVGERGVRLSGGQRQRIGIARALYRNAQVLVFDEATSALDSTTEKAVIEAIAGLDEELTIIMIAHRLSTLERCDVIFEIDAGQIKGAGTYSDLLGTDSRISVLTATGNRLAVGPNPPDSGSATL